MALSTWIGAQAGRWATMSEFTCADDYCAAHALAVHVIVLPSRRLTHFDCVVCLYCLAHSQEWMFFDVAKINAKGGDGGDGCMAMRREFRIEFGGPSGGNGGAGGSVYLECDSSLNTLSLLRRRVHHRGKDGTNGKGDSRHGYRGKDNVVYVPPGTIVRDEDGVLAGELNKHGQRLIIAKGGRGGRGNEHFKTHRMNAPAFAERGEKGAERWINIELKIVADVGFVGMPNAGKSTLLAASR
jgi:GTP-binding protein